MNKTKSLQCRSTVIYALSWLCLAACSSQPVDPREWLAGDHHIHSQYSTGWDSKTNPPTPIIGGDAIYPTPKNAQMARQFALAWMVTTDHGGPNHARVNREQAYPELLTSRQQIPEVVQFYGIELNTPAGDHSSLIIPHSHDEAQVLEELESRFDRAETYPPDAARNTEDKMIEALSAMRQLARPPVVIANHPSRSATAYGEYGLYEPRELRRWNDTAPDIAIGMAGAPGHQAIALSSNPEIPEQFRARGGYGQHPTLGGFDQMTAVVGGFWDSMLGEGRRWWITANSDSHVHYSEGGIDFWPGEYSKTFVLAAKTHDSILTNLRAGHAFVTTGDLINGMEFSVSANTRSATIGEQLTVAAGTQLTVRLAFSDPNTNNAAGRNPKVARVDLIAGSVTGKVEDLTMYQNTSAKVVQRFDVANGQSGTFTFETTVHGPTYFRVRGTNTDELEPEKDQIGEDPWQDLWFYSNPIFVAMEAEGESSSQ